MRIVLLGYRDAGKSSSGNTILGRQEFNTLARTSECVKREGKTAGRHITVVEAPGWYANFTAEDTPECHKQEIADSACLCPPGPHALLLVIRVNVSFSETRRRAVQEHLELLGERVWSHTIVLFSRGDWLGDTSIEQHIESGGEALQWVVEKCGNRYHVLDNRKSDGGQVTELLEKVEEMVAANSGHHFDFDENELKKQLLKRKTEEEEKRRAEERKMKVWRRKKTFRSSAGETFTAVEYMRVVLLGYRKAGKSSSGNTILGRQEFDTSGRTAECVKREGETAGRRITVVEAPGWWVNSTVEETPERDKREIVLSVSLCPPGPHALLLVIRVSVSFTETHRRAVQEHLELLGERVWNHTIVLFTRGDWLGDTSIEQHIESGGEALQWVIEKCGNRYHVVENKKRYDGQVTELLKKIKEMVAANSGHHFYFDENELEKQLEKKKEEERRAEERKMKVQKQRETLRSSAGGVAHILDMRVVLLGNRDAGKSSSGNTILGRQEFETSGRTAECVKREGGTAGRRITVVEAPGWWKSYLVPESPERDKREIVLSVSLCPPGPHALLLVIMVDGSFTETHRKAVQEHLELLGKGVWSHTIVLFTCGDWLGHTSIEQHIESEGAALQWVVEKCGNRYHVVDNKKSDGGQVTKLLRKIEEVVAANRGHQFNFDKNELKKQLEKKKKEQRRAEERKMKVQKQRETLGSSAGGVAHISDMRIVLLGYRIAGKSSSGNTILGRQEFDTSGRTAGCVKREGETAGRRITVVEAPGWWKDSTVEETPERDKQEIVLSVSLCPPGPHTLLLVIRVDVSFTETDRRAVQDHLELLGERVWSHTIVLFTRGDWLGDTSIEQHIESGGEALQWVVEKCGNRYHVVDNKKSDGEQVTELLEKMEEVVAANSGHHFHFDENELKKQLKKEKEEERRTEDIYDMPREQAHSKNEPPKIFGSKIPFVNEDAIQIKQFIARGSFGRVYRGSYQGTPVAVKTMPVGECPSNSLELIIPLYLSHPHIVRMIAMSRKEHEILIASEYIHGANLHQIIHTQRSIKLNEEEKMKIALEIGIAIEYIHGKTIIHQDIKPENILVSERTKTAYLTDWGLANMKGSLAQFGVSASGSIYGPRRAGTEVYMAPELFLFNERCTAMSDMWSLGLTYLEMFTGAVPWTINNPHAMIGLLSNKEPPHALTKLQPHLTEIVEPLVKYEPQSRMNATALVTRLKTKVDLGATYGYEW
ncbi:hypothetical protein ACEWY4_026328 [Coilia grayii]|uniref:GTPase IMAP family member 8-like n=1 Tax=Coilia grayii TaxID=363190 RepID=A0ABD1IUK2_9TELE